MNLAIEVLFAILVATDAILTKIIVDSRIGKEIAFCKIYVENLTIYVIITIMGMVGIIGLAELSGFFVPLYLACLAFAYAVYNNCVVLRG